MKNTIENKNPIDLSPGFSRFLFFFGNSPELAKKEVDAVAARLLPSLVFNSMLTSQAALFNCGKESQEELRQTADRLGGTVKIAEVIGQTADLGSWFKNSKNFLPNQIDKKVIFSLSNYSSVKIDISRLCLQIKNLLKSQKISLRFILPKEEQSLSSAQIFHNRLDREPNSEINIISQTNKFLLAKTIWVQNPNDWSDRDWGIPAVDPKSGMLPPKLARIMINLALPPTYYLLPTTIYDPFCGCGRVLLEAVVLGLDFLGSDIDPVKVEATKKNIRWLRDHYRLEISDQEIETKIFQANVTASCQQLAARGQTIVTEPDLGPPLRTLPTIDRVGKIAQDLSILYFKSINNLMPDSQSAVIVFPAWKTKEGRLIRFSEIIVDKITSFGYCFNRLGDYSRPNSFIVREIMEIRHGA